MTEARSPLDRALLAIARLEARLAATEKARSEPIAIVGLGCRFPAGGTDPEAYWQALMAGRDGVVPIPAERWPTGELDGPARAEHAGARLAGIIGPVDGFDHEFFGISPRECASLDPQHRLLMELAWEALEDAGIVPTGLQGSRSGVFLGATNQDYLVNIQQAGLAALDAYTATGNGLCFAAGRLAYTFGLQGPALTLDTACSSSLVAVHAACQSLRAGECDLALSGGVSLILSPLLMATMTHTQTLSPDGRCRSFDARANGIARGEGGGLVVLERLSDALRLGHPVRAVIRGSAINQDGRSAGLTTPNGAAQAALHRAALAAARLGAERVDYVETHGTGTSLGDPIEAEALAAVYGAPRPDGAPLLLGAVKSNLGHLEAAAGIAGLIKAVLCLQRGMVPPNLHFQHLNPRITLTGTPLRVPTTPTPLPQRAHPAVAGVSAFGLSGTNAHVLLEATPAPPSSPAASPAGSPAASPAASPAGAPPGVTPRARPALVRLSARSEAALSAMAGRWAQALETATPAVSPTVDDVAWTSLRRAELPHQLVLPSRDLRSLGHDLALAARGELPAGAARGVAPSEPPRLVFVFPGQGSQWVGMGRQLYADEPAFRASFQRCDAAMRVETGWSLVEELHAEAPRLGEVDVAQPLLVAMSVSLAALWERWGLRPDAVVGHSMGEVAAACVAGALDLADAAAVIVRRSRLLRAEMHAGAMAIVELPEADAAAAIADLAGRVTVAGSNSPRTTILAGPFDALELLERRFSATDVFFRVVRGTPPSHCPLIAHLGPPLRAALAGLRPREARLPMVSTARPVPGGLVRTSPALDAEYWVDNLLCPVRFTEAVQQLAAEGPTVFLEVSAHPVLLGPLRQTLAGSTSSAFGSLRRDADEPLALAESLAGMMVAGVRPDPEALTPAGRRMTLPGYPWQRQRHWIDAPKATTTGVHPSVLQAPVLHPLLGRRDGERWETELSATHLPWLLDHTVGATAILPTTAWIELARAAAEALWGPGAHTIEELRLEAALHIPARGPGVHVRLSLNEAPGEAGEAAGSRRSFEVQSVATGRRHVTGQLVRADVTTARALPDRGALVAGAPESGEALRAELATRALRYGAAFAGVSRLWRRDGTAFGELEIPASIVGELDRFGAHPALVDAALQVLAGAFCGRAALPPGTWLPVAVGSARVFRPIQPGLSGPLLAWAQVQLDDGELDPAEPGGDVWLYDADGHLLVEALGLRLAPLDAAADPWLHTLRWVRPVPAPPAPPLRGAWLVLVDGAQGRSLATSISGLIAADGATVVTLDPAPGAERALRDTLVSRRDWTGVVYARGLDGDDPGPGRGEPALEVLRLVQELGRLGLRSPPRLVLLTAGAVALDDEVRPLRLSGAALWGLGAAIVLEQPELGVLRIDLDPSGGTDPLPTLRAVMAARADAQDELDPDGLVVLRRDGARVARLVRAEPPARAQMPARGAASGAQTFRAQIGRVGHLDALTLVPDRARAPGPGEALIMVERSGLNLRDVLLALGVVRAPGRPEAVALGSECVGTILALGPQRDPARPAPDWLRVGARVLGFGEGTLAARVVLPVELIRPVPEGLSPEQAATFPVVFTTVYAALERAARLRRGETVLIHAGTGGIGLAAIQWARHVGAEIITTAGSEEKRAYLRALGVERVSDSRSDRFVDDVLAWTDGRGVDVVLNSLSGPLLRRGYDALADYGRFIEIGAKQYTQNAASRSQSVSIVDLRGDVVDRPAAGGALLDATLGHLRAGVFTSLPVTRFGISELSAAFRTMSEARHIGKLVLDLEDPAALVRRPRARPAAIVPERPWVISGGLTGVGLETVDWLVGLGVRRVALLGRRAPAPATEARILAWRAAGITVMVRSVDVADAVALAAALAAVRAELGPLGGVVHAAAVLRDGVLASQTAEGFAEVWASKAIGAWNLHTLTREDPLSHFVLCSSAAALLGSPGQANYCAANALVDALARHRHGLGLPALSLQWGPFAEIGLAAAQDNRGARIAAMGLESLGVAEARERFVRLLGSPADVVGVLALDARRWRQSHPQAARSPLFAELGAVGARAEVGALELIVPEARRGWVEALLRTQVAAVLRIDPARVTGDAMLGKLGLDSLMAIELRNRLEAATGHNHPVTMFWNHPTVERLVDHLVEKMWAPTGTSEPSSAEPSSAERSSPEQASPEQASPEQASAEPSSPAPSSSAPPPDPAGGARSPGDLDAFDDAFSALEDLV